MSIAQFTVDTQSIFGQRQYVGTLHIMGKRISTLMGEHEPTAADLEATERRLRRNFGRKPSKFVSAYFPAGHVDPTLQAPFASGGAI